jgi:hypothetical protein
MYLGATWVKTKRENGDLPGNSAHIAGKIPEILPMSSLPVPFDNALAS